MKKTKKILSLVLAVLMFFSCLIVSTQAVSFTPRLSEPSTTSEYWIHTSYGGLNSCIIASGNSVLPNCVGYAWGRAYEILGNEPDLSRLDAGQWFGINQNKYDAGNGGYPYTTDITKPKLGAIACWSDSNGAGHVAVIEKINGDQITTSESGWGSARFWTKDRNITDIRLGQKDNYTFQGYIYLLNDSIQTGDKVEFNGHYYQVFDEGLDWFEAKSKCEELGGHLVTITSQEEQDFVNDYVKNGNRINYWLGATDEKVEGEWEWVSGESFEYENWHSGEPSNSEYIENEFENYLILWADLNCVWNDAYYDVGERLPSVGHTKIEDIGFM